MIFGLKKMMMLKIFKMPGNKYRKMKMLNGILKAYCYGIELYFIQLIKK